MLFLNVNKKIAYAENTALSDASDAWKGVVKITVTREAKSGFFVLYRTFCDTHREKEKGSQVIDIPATL